MKFCYIISRQPDKFRNMPACFFFTITFEAIQGRTHRWIQNNVLMQNVYSVFLFRKNKFVYLPCSQSENWNLDSVIEFKIWNCGCHFTVYRSNLKHKTISTKPRGFKNANVNLSERAKIFIDIDNLRLVM